jgi:two-component system chemotaxis sensor kinase CheA
MSLNAKTYLEPIVIVDDEADLLETLAALVSVFGCRVFVCQSGEEALKKIEAEKPFLVIADYRMPGMDGIELCKQVRKNGSTLTYILHTGFADKQTAIGAMHAGIDDILEKPADGKAVKAIVQKCIDKRVAQIDQERKEVEEITDLFVEESRDLLSDLDQLLLRLEEVPLDTVVVDLLFRKVHSVKGGAGAIPQGELLAGLAHHFESVLSKVKKERWAPGEAGLNVFLESADLCRLHLDLIASRAKAGSDIVERTNAAIGLLERLKNGDLETSHGTEAPQPLVTAAAMAVSSSGPKAQAGQPAKLSEGNPRAETADSSDDDGVFVASDKLDSFMKVSGEMVVLKNTFSVAIRDPEVRADLAKLDKRLNDFLYALNKITDTLQEQIMSVRKVSLDRALSKLPRLVRQTAQDVGKKVQFVTNGFQLGVDKTIAKALSASLTHMVRNSIDHGIEKPDVRAARGKSLTGTITITARELQGNIQIVIEDDGAGIDRARVVKKAIEKGLVDEETAAKLSDSEAFELIFLPGFSTAEQVSAVSGRGVGMDVVRSSILALNGRITIASKAGEGSKFVLDIPIPKTVMVEQTVVAESHGTLVAVPLQAISRIIPGEEVKTVKVDGVVAFLHDNRTIRLIDHRALAPFASHEVDYDPRRGSVVVLRNKANYVGLHVDAIFDQLEAVVRPFDAIIQEIPGFCGTTLLGDDRIAYVVSPAEVVSIALGVTEQAA